MIFFWIVFSIDVVAALVALFFFVVGLGDGSVSSFNMALWLGLLGGIAVIVGSGWTLNGKGHRAAANVLLSILGVPAFVFGLFMLLIVILQPNWR